MLILSIVIGALFLFFLISLAVKEDIKTQQQVKEKKLEAKGESSAEDNPITSWDEILEKMERFNSVCSYGSEASYKGLKLNMIHASSRHVFTTPSELLMRTKSGGRLSYEKYSTTVCNGDIREFIETHYGQHNTLVDKVVAFLNDFIRDAVVYKGASIKLKEFYEQNGIKFKTQYDEDIWYSINDGEYYTTYHSSLYRLSDWYKMDTDEAYEIVKNAKIELSEDPKKVHWEHFLKLEMLEKKAREKRMQEFVDNVLSKQVKYNDLQLQFEMLPTAPITDIETFKNFCKIVKEDVYYEDHEIQNYIFMKKLK